MSALRLTGSTSGYSEITPPAVAGDQTFTLPGTGGTLDRLNRVGNILQVVSTTKTDTFTTQSDTFIDITGLSASITPTLSSSKILIIASVIAGQTESFRNVYLALVRNTTNIFIGDAASARSSVSGGTEFPGSYISLDFAPIHLDSPNTTSSVTYKIQVRRDGSRSTPGTACINRTGDDADFASRGRFASSITLLEIAA